MILSAFVKVFLFLIENLLGIMIMKGFTMYSIIMGVSEPSPLKLYSLEIQVLQLQSPEYVNFGC